MKTNTNPEIQNEYDYKIFDNLQEDVVIYDVMRDMLDGVADLRVKYINNSSILNEITSPEGAIDKTVTELYDTDLITLHLKIANEVLKSGEGKKYETYFKSLDKYYSVSAYLVDDDTYITISKDITKYKKAENVAFQANENLEQTFNAVPDLIAILDNDHKVIRANKAMAERLGVTPEECIGLPCYSVVHGTNEPPSFCPHSQLLEDGLKHTTEVHEDNLGGNFIVSVSPLRDSEGELIGSVHVARDINEQKHAEEQKQELLEKVQHFAEELEASNEELRATTEELQVTNEELQDTTEKLQATNEKIQRFADVVESSDDAIITKSLEGTILSWNVGAEYIYGYSAEEVFGKSISLLEPSQLRQETVDLINKIKSGERIDHYETLRLRKDGTVINVSVTLSPVFSTSRELVAISAISRDITERKKVEQQNEKLLEEVQQFSEELEVSNEELQVTNEELNVSNEELENTTEELQVANEELNATTEELQAVNEKIQSFADVIESSDDAIITKSLEGTILSWNKGAEYIYGYSAEEVFGKPISILEPSQLGHETEILIDRIKSGERIDHYETLRLRNDGALINVSVTLSPVFDTSGELVAISTISRDITDRKKVEEQNQKLLEDVQQFAEELEVSNEELRATTEELHVSNEELREQGDDLVSLNQALQESKEHYQQFFDNPLTGFALCEIITDDKKEPIDFVYLQVNDAFEDFTGLKKEDVLNKKVTDVLPIEEVAPAIEIYGKVASTGESEQFEISIPSLDKTYDIVAFSPRKMQFIAMFTDITERKKAKEQIEMEKKRLETVLETSPAAIIIIEASNGKISYINKRAKQIYGVDVTGLDLATTINKVKSKRTDGSEYPIGEGPSGRALKGQEVHGEEMILERSDGTVIPISSSTAPIFNSEGKVIAAVAIFEDITKRKQAEKERETTVEFLHLVNESIGTLDLIQSATTFFQEKSGCEAVGIRLREEEDYPYYEARGFPEKFILLENELCERDEEGKIIRDNDNNPLIEYMCGNVICGRFDPSQSFFTADGSFWTNSTTELLVSASEEDRQARTRNRCNGEGYESVALIPLYVGKQRLGLLQLNDKKEGMFSPEIISLWERMAGYLSVALAKYKAEEALQNANDNLEELVEKRTEELEEAYKDLKMNEEELKKQAELLNLTHESIIVRNMDSKILFWNDGAEETYGWSIEEAKDKITHSLLSTEFPTSLEDIDKELVNNDKWEGELVHTKRDGTQITVLSRQVLKKDKNGNPISILEINSDITERKKAEERFRKEVERESLLLELYEKAPQLTDKELYNYILDHAVRLTDSTIGFFHMVSDDQKTINLTTWNIETLKNCEASFNTHYPIEQAGNWVDCIPLKRPVIYNDFKNSPNRKGLPEGHIPLEKFMSIPVMDEDKVIFIFGVGNKTDDYNDHDAIQIQLVANELNKIIKQRRFEEALRLSDIYNRSLIEASLDPLVTIGPNGKITDVNDSTEAVTGYSRDELIGTDFSDYFTEPEKAREGYQHVFQEGLVRDYPLEIKHKNGSITPVIYNASVYKDEDGEVIGIFAAARDITERKRAEAEKQNLLEQTQQFAEELEVINEELQNTTEELQITNRDLELASKYNRSLIEASLDPLVTIGPNGKITDVNWATELVTGYYRDELIGTDFSDYFTEPKMAREGYQHVFNEGFVRDYPLEIQHKNGDVTPVLYNASVYKNESGEITGIFAAARDITELKESEEMLRKSGEKYRTLFNSIDEGFCIIEVIFDANNKPLDYRFLEVNPAFEKQTGLIEAKGKLMRELAPDHEEYWFEIYGKIALTGKPMRFINPAEALNRWYDVYAFKIGNQESRKVAIIFNDITKSKEAEKQLNEIIDELKRSNDELEQFAYITSHDLQEPLRNIASFAQLLEMRYKGKLDSDADEFLDYMVDGASRMKQMILGLLDYSRVGTQGEELKLMNMEDAVDQSLSNLKTAIEESNAIIDVDPLPTVVADKHQIIRLFQNIIGNAIKFRKDDEPPKIHISAREDKENNEYIFSVSDNGIGMESQYTNQIFKVFKRLHSIGKYPGAGIGLSITKRIIERHDGHIWVESEFGTGSTFYFTLQKSTIFDSQKSKISDGSKFQELSE